MENLDQNQFRQTEKPITVGDWMITMLIMCIPLINIVMIFVWAFGGNTPPSKVNWAKATLIWIVIGIIISVIILILFASAIFAGRFF